MSNSLFSVQTYKLLCLGILNHINNEHNPQVWCHRLSLDHLICCWNNLWFGRDIEPSQFTFMSIIPAPLASFTWCPLSILVTLPSDIHNTNFPLTFIFSSASALQNASLTFLISGNSVSEKSLGWNPDSPSISFPSPRHTVALSFLSVVLAPTVRSHGSQLFTVPGSGPVLPAEQLTINLLILLLLFFIFLPEKLAHLCIQWNVKFCI